MTFGVSRNTLLLTAGLVWLIAGANILRIGIGYWLGTTQYWIYKILEATAVFVFFFGFIFNRLFLKHTQRIAHKKEKNCPFAFFDVKGWIMMTAMMTMGIVIRRQALLPEHFHCRLLYRAFAGTGHYRSAVYTLLVQTPKRPIIDELVISSQKTIFAFCRWLSISYLCLIMNRRKSIKPIKI